MKGIVMNTSQISDGTVKYTISDQGFVSRVGDSKNLSIRNLSRFGNTILGGLKNFDRHLQINQLLLPSRTSSLRRYVPWVPHPSCSHSPHCCLNASSTL